MRVALIFIWKRCLYHSAHSTSLFPAHARGSWGNNLQRTREVNVNQYNLYNKGSPHRHKNWSSPPGAGGVLIIFLGGVVPPGPENPYPISDQNIRFSIPYFRPDSQNVYPISDPVMCGKFGNSLNRFTAYLYGLCMGVALPPPPPPPPPTPPVQSTDLRLISFLAVDFFASGLVWDSWFSNTVNLNL